MIIASGIDIFSDSGSAKTGLATYPSWTDGSEIQPPKEDVNLIVVTFELSGTAPTAIYAKLTFYNPNESGAAKNRGMFPSMSYDSGVVTWVNTVHKLQLDSGDNFFFQPMIGGYSYKMSVGMTGGDGTTGILAKADLKRES